MLFRSVTLAHHLCIGIEFSTSAIRAELIVLLGHNFERNKSFQRRRGIEAEQNSSFIRAERTQAYRQLSLKTFRLHLF